MPDNQSEALKIAFMIALPVGIAVLNAWMNIAIKFAPDAAHAKREIRSLLLSIMLWIGSLVMLGNVVREFVSPYSNPRLSLLVILLNAFGVFNTYVHWIVGRLYLAMKQQMEIMRSISEHMLRLAEERQASTKSN